MVSLFLRNLLFTIIQPGIVVGLLPFWILGDKVKKNFQQRFEFYHYSGIIIFAIGLVIMLICIFRFAVQGRGTLSPADPTKKLVVEGLYRFSRNPMYVGVIMMLIGESIIFQSFPLLVYSVFVFTAFNIFIRFYEEPRLRSDFGEVYDKYCEKVRRWI